MMLQQEAFFLELSSWCVGLTKQYITENQIV